MGKTRPTVMGGGGHRDGWEEEREQKRVQQTTTGNENSEMGDKRVDKLYV